MSDVTEINPVYLEITDPLHIRALELRGRGYCTYSGGALLESGTPDMKVNMDAWVGWIAGVRTSKSATFVTADAQDATYDRIDVVYLTTAGALALHKGTAAAITPSGLTTDDWKKFEKPRAANETLPVGVILGKVHIKSTANGGGTITNDDIEMISSYSLDYLYFTSEARGDFAVRGADNWVRFAGVEQGSILYEGANLDPGWLAHGSYADRLMSGGHGANPFFAGADGWMPIPVTCTYASADDPTFTFTLPGDWTGIMRKGTRFKLTQTSAKYFICSADPVYSSPNTTITMYGGTDYDLANAAITSPYFSNDRFPSGFPASQAKWSVVVTDTGDRSASVTGGAWSNVGSISIPLPIGLWWVSYKAYTGAASEQYTTLSTANNSESNKTMTLVNCAAVSGTVTLQPTLVEKTAKATHYLNQSPGSTNTCSVYGSYVTTLICAVCAYL